MPLKPNDRYLRPSDRYVRPSDRYLWPNDRYLWPKHRYLWPNNRYLWPNDRYLWPVLGVRETVAVHRLGALEGGTSPPSNASLGVALHRVTPPIALQNVRTPGEGVSQLSPPPPPPPRPPPKVDLWSPVQPHKWHAGTVAMLCACSPQRPPSFRCLSSPVSVYAEAHKWHNAYPLNPWGSRCFSDAALGLVVGGDWCVGPRAHDAYDSGLAMAAQAASILGSTHN